MARICSLVSVSSSILLWRLSKICGSIIPDALAMVVERGRRSSRLGLRQRTVVMELEVEASRSGAKESRANLRENT